jgi:hypothetical protein
VRERAAAGGRHGDVMWSLASLRVMLSKGLMWPLRRALFLVLVQFMMPLAQMVQKWLK